MDASNAGTTAAGATYGQWSRQASARISAMLTTCAGVMISDAR